MATVPPGAFLVRSLNDGGIARAVLALLEAWPPEDRPVLLIYSSALQRVEVPEGVEAVWLDGRRPHVRRLHRSARAVVAAVRLLRTAQLRRLQWIVAAGGYMPGFSGIVSRMGRFRSIAWMHSGHYSDPTCHSGRGTALPHALAEAIALSLNTRILALSPTGMRDLLSRFPHLRSRAGVMPNLDRLHATPPGGRRRTAREGVMHLATIGRLRPVKRYERAIQFAAALRDIGQRVRLSVYGQGPDEERLRDVAVQAGAEDIVRFEGYVPDVESILSRTDALLVTSRYEAFPNVVMEAFSSRVLVVLDASTHGGVCDLVRYRGEPAAMHLPLEQPRDAAARFVDLLQRHGLVDCLLDRAEARVGDFAPQTIVDRWRSEVNALF